MSDDRDLIEAEKLFLDLSKVCAERGYVLDEAQLTARACQQSARLQTNVTIRKIDAIPRRLIPKLGAN